MRAMRLPVILALLAGCGPMPPPAGGGGAPAAAPAAHPELSRALAPLAWWLGAWSSPGNAGTEHWVAVDGAIYGVALHPSGEFEVMIVDDGPERPGHADGVWRFVAMPGGARAVEFRHRASSSSSVTFANDAHDFPTSITYARHGDTLDATLGGDGGRTERFRFTRASALPAPELEAADRAFAADTAARGVDGWMAAFEPAGASMRGGARLEGEELAAAMAPMLAAGRLTWEPIASGRRDLLGFTIGRASYTGNTTARFTYATIWRRQPDGGWKVAFDVGRPVHD